jgi:hypothetical protein
MINMGSYEPLPTFPSNNATKKQNNNFTNTRYKTNKDASALVPMHPRLQSPDYRQLAEKSSNAACLHEGRGAVQCSVPQVPGVDDVEVDGFGQGGGYGLQAHANYAG